MNEHFIFNGQMMPAGTLIEGASSPALLYGEGIFETMRVHHQKIINEKLHFDRLKTGCSTLNIPFSEQLIGRLTEDILQITKLYPSENFLRARLALFRKTTDNLQSPPDYLISGYPIAAPAFNDSGIKTIIYRDSLKGMGAISNLKNNNYLVHLSALRFAKKNDADEAIVLNSFERICETSMANIFFIEGDQIFTPRLSEGCVSGTIRKYLLTVPSPDEILIKETTCSIDRLLNADEIFITNAIRWVEPVTSVEGRAFNTKIAKSLFDYLERVFK